ncbi:MAG: S8 family serine peptidase [Bacteroidota bacterium]
MRIITTFMLLIAYLGVHTQDDAWQAIIEEKVPAKYNMSANIYQIAKYTEEVPLKKVIEQIQKGNLLFKTNHGLHVELVYGTYGKDKINVDEVKNAGLTVNLSWENRVDGWIMPDKLLAFSENLSDKYYIYGLEEEEHNNQGPAAMNSDTYRDNGKDGSGIKVAILDRGYSNINAVVNANAAPSSYTGQDYTGNGFTGGTGVHGTACVEAVFDHAPGATYYMYNVSSTSGTQWANAVNHAIANNVNVITSSLGPHNTGWDDNSGPQNAAVLNALNDGMLFFSTAGNETAVHYQSNFRDLDNDNWHTFTNGDERNYMTLAASNNNNDNDRVTAWLQWDGSASTDDYDMYLYNSSGTVLASGNSASGFESLSYTNPLNNSVQVYIGIYHFEGNSTEFELFTTRSLEHAVPESSIECPSNNSWSNAISVGAVYRTNYGDAPGTDPIASYSSHGPTNGGRQAPDIAALTGSTTVTYNGDFNGTSCAAPNAAGAAVALWSALPNYDATGIRQVLLRKAQLAKDWGDSGTDYVYGHGGLVLYDYKTNPVYVYRSAGNTSGSNTRPYYNIEQVDANAPTNANVTFLGQDYPTPPAGSTIINKKAIYRSFILDAEVKN